MKATDAFKRCFQPWQFYTDSCAGHDDWEGGTLMWIVRPAEDGSWLVGYWYPDRVTFFTESCYRGAGAQSKATARMRWLYGSNDPEPPVGEQPLR